MTRSKEAKRNARQLLRATFVEGRLDGERAKAIVKGVQKVKPRGYIHILEAYLKLLRLELEKRHAIVESATPLDANLESQVRGDLARSYGDDLTFEFRVDPALLGGMRIQVGSDVWDGSVKARLAQLADAIG